MLVLETLPEKDEESTSSRIFTPSVVSFDTHQLTNTMSNSTADLDTTLFLSDGEVGICFFDYLSNGTVSLLTIDFLSWSDKIYGIKFHK